MIILWKHFKTKIKKIGQIERMLHCVKIDKLKKMTVHFCRSVALLLKFVPQYPTAVIFEGFLRCLQLGTHDAEKRQLIPNRWRNSSHDVTAFYARNHFMFRPSGRSGSEPNLDCNYLFPVHLAPNRIRFGAKSIGKV